MRFLAAADALKALMADVEGVKVAAIGINQSWPSTPAVEVIPVGFDLETLAAGGRAQIADGEIYLAAYVAMTRNLDDDERTLLPIVERIVSLLQSETFDSTLGGLVEDVRAVSVGFDIVQRNKSSFRSAVIQLAVDALSSAP